MGRHINTRIANLLCDSWKAEPHLRPSFAAILDMMASYEASGGEIEPPPDLNMMVGAGCQCAIS